MPPGPWGFPLLGVAHKLNAEAPFITFTEWKQQYGDVFSFTLFGKYNTSSTYPGKGTKPRNVGNLQN